MKHDREECTDIIHDAAKRISGGIGVCFFMMLCCTSAQLHSYVRFGIKSPTD